MRRDELTELHYITCIENVPSMLEHGLLSHDRMEELDHVSVALEGVQDLRAGKLIAGRPLHSYVNLYLWARNAMLYLRFRGDGRRDLCVLSVSHKVVDLPGVVVTDRNASVGWARPQLAAQNGLEIVDKATTFAERWDHPDPFERERRKTAGQAEVLVPDEVPPRYIRGAYTFSRAACATLNDLVPTLKLRPWPYLFFLGGTAARGDLYEPS